MAYGDASDGGPQTELLTDPFADDLEPMAEVAEPAPEPEPTEPAPARALVAQAELENADTTLMPPPFPPTVPQSPASPSLSDNSLIMAVVCQYGHAEPTERDLLPDLRQPDRAAGPAAAFLGRCSRCCAPPTGPPPRSTGPC